MKSEISIPCYWKYFPGRPDKKTSFRIYLMIGEDVPILYIEPENWHQEMEDPDHNYYKNKIYVLVYSCVNGKDYCLPTSILYFGIDKAKAAVIDGLKVKGGTE